MKKINHLIHKLHSSLYSKKLLSEEYILEMLDNLIYKIAIALDVEKTVTKEQIYAHLEDMQEILDFALDLTNITEKLLDAYFTYTIENEYYLTTSFLYKLITNLQKNREIKIEIEALKK